MITETREKLKRRRTPQSSPDIHKISPKRCQCLWRVGLEKKKSFEVGKEE